MRERKAHDTRRVLAHALAAIVGLAASVAAGPARSGNYDGRVEVNRDLTVVRTSQQEHSLGQLAAEVPGLAAEFDRSTGAVRTLSSRTGYLTTARAGDALEVGLSFVGRNRELFGLEPADLSDYEITDRVLSSASGATHIYLRQRHRGIPVYNGQLHLNVNRDGRLLSVNNAFLPGLAAAVNAPEPTLGLGPAVREALLFDGIALADPPRPIPLPADVEGGAAVDPAGVSLEPVVGRLMWLPIRRGEARLVWNFQIATLDRAHVYDTNVDAATGKVWTRFDWVARDSYLVFDRPIESPNHGNRSLVVDTANLVASPFGWHDTNGAAGAEFNTTQGNNVHAYLDRDGDDVVDAGSSPDGGQHRDFDFPLDLSRPPGDYREAAVTNLFHLNNVVHDVQYQYGFDEAAGNFQANNYGHGGAANDSVRAEGQDGGFVNNAWFFTPPDGQRPRMEMNLFTGPNPDRDSDLDTGIVVHEYGHGISNRLVGGPTNVSCLANAQAPGEGLSDWWALAYTAEPGDTGTGARGLGTYAMGQAIDGVGIRNRRYSTDPAVNDWTYGSISDFAGPHGVGQVWAQGAWEAYWRLVDHWGFDPNLFDAHGSSGNQRMMLYVNEGLMNTPCSPSFTDIRDGIIQAAVDNHGGEDVCRLWRAFAAFGLGEDADSNGGNSTDPDEGFAVPAGCPADGGGDELHLTARPVPGGWDQVELDWTTDEEGIEQFVVQRQRPPAGWQTIATLGPAERHYDDVVPEIPDAGGPMYYFYRIRADYEGSTLESNRAEGRMYGDPPATPDTLRPRGCIDTLDPTLSWHGGQSTAFNAYLVETQTGREWWWETDVPFSPVPEPLVSGMAYVLKVIGRNNIGNGSTSNPEYFVPFCAPTTPPRIDAPFGCTASLTPQVSWTPGAPGQTVLWYHVVVNRVTNIDSDPEVITVDVPGTQTSWTFPPGLLTAGTEYRVKVNAFTGVAGAYSELAFFTPQCNASGPPGTASPIAPGGTVPTSQPTYVWRPASLATAHRVEVYTTTWQTALSQTFPTAGTCDGATCSARPAQALPDATYHWRILGSNTHGSALYGPWATFTVVNQNPSLSVSDVTVAEGAGAAQFVLHLDHAPATSVTVQVATADGTAQAPSDYTAVSGPVTIPMGTTDFPVSVPVAGDASFEPDETFTLTVSNAIGAAIADGQAQATITNDDLAPRIVAGASVYWEAGPGKGAGWTVPVRIEGERQQDVTVAYSFGSCTADANVDFAPASGVLTFHPGDTQRLAPLTVFDDQAPEGHEMAALHLSSPVGGVIGSTPGQTTIVNDDPPSPVALRSDFDGDGNNDVIWRDSATGALSLWRLVGVNKIATLPFDPPAPAAAGWVFSATADFNADGHPDLVWRNTTSGRLSFWLMNGVVRTSGQLVDGETDLAWKLVATGRFGGSASPDLLWRHDTTGDLKVWLMDGLVKQGESLLSPSHPIDANWAFQGAGDLDADGKDDVLWRNLTSGNLVAWLMDGTVRREARFLSPLTQAGWEVAALVDVDEDGATDVLWQRADPQQLGAWLMQGTTQRCAMPANPTLPDSPGWRVVGPR